MKSIKTKILGLCLLGLIVAAGAIVGIILLQKGSLRDQINVELMILADNETKKIAENVYTMCAIADEEVQNNTNRSLNVIRSIMDSAGTPRLSDEKVTWNAVNQNSKASQQVSLPRFMVGNTWLGNNASKAVRSPIVDEAQDLVGGVFTVFQRMNDSGDMLRVCSNVLTESGDRAVGTYVPATNSDGSPNAVVSAVMSGQTFRGRAKVVDDWYVTAYEPIFDSNKKVIGILSVGIKQENVTSLREGIRSVVVGKTGYVFVIQGSGDTRGNYVIGSKAEDDGKPLWELQDANQNYFIQDIVNGAVEAGEKEVVYVTYPYEHPTTKKIEEKVSACIYYEPWDWVIGAGAYKSDFQDALNSVDGAIGQMVFLTLMVALAIVILAGLFAFFVSGKIANPIILAAKFAGHVADGDLTQSMDVKLSDEVGTLINALNSMSSNLHTMVTNLTSAANEVAASSEELSAGADETSKAIQEVAVRVSDVATASAQTTETADQAKENLDQTASAIEGVSHDIEEVATYATAAVDQSAQGKEAADSAVQIITQAANNVQETAGMVETLGEKTTQIGEFIGIITGIADQTNLLALNAAIEAARAGEAGRGFAVVAEEVRKLAEESNQAAGKITELIKGIEQEMNTALNAMKKSTEVVNEGAEAVDQASHRFADIVEGITSLNEKVQNISAAAEEINASTSEVVNGMIEVAELATKNSHATGDVSAATEEQTATMEEVGANASNLAKLAQQLQELVAQFKV